MKTYDNYEISPCTREEEPDSPGKYCFEVCEPDEADVWTLYGHIDGEGVEAIDDFETREYAEHAFQRIVGIPFTGAREVCARLRTMHSASKILNALKFWANHGDFDEFVQMAREVIAEVEGTTNQSAAPNEPRPAIIIEVRGGAVQEVRNVPPGVAYQIVDHDNIEEQEPQQENKERKLSMTNDVIEMTEEEFDKQYPVLINHLNANASWAFGDGRGCLFETHGEELEFVQRQDPRTIWTLVDGDDVDQYLISGFRFVNRIGYLVSTVTIPEGVNIEVRIPMQTIPSDHMSI